MSDRMSLALMSCAPNFASPANPSGSNIAFVEDDGTIAYQNLPLSGSYAVNKATGYLSAVLRSGNSASQDQVFGLQVVYNDAGPRSF